MRPLTPHELQAVAGAAKSGGIDTAALAARWEAIKAALAEKGITFALDQAAGTLTITTPKGSKTIHLPACKPTTEAA